MGYHYPQLDELGIGRRRPQHDWVTLGTDGKTYAIEFWNDREQTGRYEYGDDMTSALADFGAIVVEWPSS